MKPELICTKNGYDFYRLKMGENDVNTWWNIVPKGDSPPIGGYRSRSYIEKIKHQEFPKGEDRV